MFFHKNEPLVVNTLGVIRNESGQIRMIINSFNIFNPLNYITDEQEGIYESKVLTGSRCHYFVYLAVWSV